MQTAVVILGIAAARRNHPREHAVLGHFDSSDMDGSRTWGRRGDWTRFPDRRRRRSGRAAQGRTGSVSAGGVGGSRDLPLLPHEEEAPSDPADPGPRPHGCRRLHSAADGSVRQSVVRRLRQVETDELRFTHSRIASSVTCHIAGEIEPPVSTVASIAVMSCSRAHCESNDRRRPAHAVTAGDQRGHAILCELSSRIHRESQ